MRKKKMHALAAVFAALCMLAQTACAAEQEQVPEPQEQIVSTEGMVYLPNCSVYFADVDAQYDWAYHEIDYLANTGVASGTGYLIYSPLQSISRADFVLMLYRAYDMEKYIAGENFADIPQNAYYADALRAAKAIGIASGDQKNRFRPNETLTRQDAMTLLKRTLDRTRLAFEPGDLSGYRDSSQIAPYASESLAALTGAGVVGGANGALNPKSPINRAEMAVMLYRALHLSVVDGAAKYLPQPTTRLVAVGSTIYADAKIANFETGKKYAGLYRLEKMVQSEDGYAITLGEAERIDDRISWDGTTLKVNDIPMPTAPDCEAIAVDMYSKRKAGLTSTGAEYQTGAVSVVNERVQTVYYKK